MGLKSFCSFIFLFHYSFSFKIPSSPLPRHDKRDIFILKINPPLSFYRPALSRLMADKEGVVGLWLSLNDSLPIFSPTMKTNVPFHSDSYFDLGKNKYNRPLKLQLSLWNWLAVPHSSHRSCWTELTCQRIKIQRLRLNYLLNHCYFTSERKEIPFTPSISFIGEIMGLSFDIALSP